MNTRIKAIVEAATSLFLRQGYAQTQISHIAKAAGVSVGTIYHDFTGKNEIMHMVLKCTIDPDFIEQDFDKPISDDLFEGIENEIVALFKEKEAVFARNLENDNYCFETLISDSFDTLARYAVGCLFIEKNQYEFTFLAENYKAYRKQFFKTITQYVSGFIREGTIRPMKHLDLSVTLIIETLTWWAMDRQYISFETSAIPLSLAKEVCMDNLVSAYKM
ncbi:MAG: TetR/AcrR family transcriptional regulator [Streptococcaceae bacterium]|jgi:AcrR family transcriptional regulator|nr:TetR/AcrR family transcriptional regulator [Streptococcaceae bacterium]